MGKWLTNLDVRVLGDRDFMNLVPLSYQANDGIIHTVPHSRRTNFGSVWGIPCISELLAGKANKSCTLHDWNYNGGITRLKADQLIYECALAEELGFEEAQFIADVLYNGVRDFGKSAYRGPKEWSD